MSNGEETQRVPRSPLPSILLFLGGVLVALWIAVGRFLFGVGGSLTPWYLLLGTAVLFTQGFAARTVFLTSHHGYRSRAWTILCIAFSWLAGVLNGLTLPDITSQGMRTILNGPNSTGLQIAIGVTNPCAILCLALAAAAIFLGYYDARGRKPKYDEDAILDERARLGLPLTWPDRAEIRDMTHREQDH